MPSVGWALVWLAGGTLLLIGAYGVLASAGITRAIGAGGILGGISDGGIFGQQPPQPLFRWPDGTTVDGSDSGAVQRASIVSTRIAPPVEAGRQPQCLIMMRYDDALGRPVTAEHRVFATAWCDQPQGSRIPIVVAPEPERRVATPGTDPPPIGSRGQLLIPSVIAIAIGLLLFLVGSRLDQRASRRRRRRNGEA